MRDSVASTLVLLLLGALATVVVSGLCSVWPIPKYVSASVIASSDLAIKPEQVAEVKEIPGDIWSHLGLLEINMYWTPIRPDGDSIPAWEIAAQLDALYDEICGDNQVSSDNCRFDTREQLIALRRGPLPPGLAPQTPAMLYVESGFPFRAMAGMVYWPADLPGSMVIPRELWSCHLACSYAGRSVSRVIPLRPRFLPFLANALIFAMLFRLSILACGFGCRRFRRRRGLCPICCYDLSHADHAACPECGWHRRITGSDVSAGRQ